MHGRPDLQKPCMITQQTIMMHNVGTSQFTCNPILSSSQCTTPTVLPALMAWEYGPKAAGAFVVLITCFDVAIVRSDPREVREVTADTTRGRLRATMACIVRQCSVNCLGDHLKIIG